MDGVALDPSSLSPTLHGGINLPSLPARPLPQMAARRCTQNSVMTQTSVIPRVNVKVGSSMSLNRTTETSTQTTYEPSIDTLLDRKAKVLQRCIRLAPVPTTTVFRRAKVQAQSRATRLKVDNVPSVSCFFQKLADASSPEAVADRDAEQAIASQLSGTDHSFLGDALTNAATHEPDDPPSQYLVTQCADAAEQALREVTLDPEMHLAVLHELVVRALGKAVPLQTVIECADESDNVTPALRKVFEFLLPEKGKKKGGRMRSTASHPHRQLVLTMLALLRDVGKETMARLGKLLGVSAEIQRQAREVKVTHSGIEIPDRVRRKDAIKEEGVLGKERARAYWHDETRPSEGKKDYRKGGRGKNVTPHVVHWLYQDFGDFYNNYCTEVIAEALAELQELEEQGRAPCTGLGDPRAGAPPAVSPPRPMSRKVFNSCRPFYVIKAHNEVCACYRCMAFDLMCAAFQLAIDTHCRSRKCSCAKGQPRVDTARLLEQTLLCPRLPAEDGMTAHDSYDERCVYGTCTQPTCGWAGSISIRPSCLGSSMDAPACPTTLAICPELYNSDKQLEVQTWQRFEVKKQKHGEEITDKKYEFLPEKLTFQQLFKRLKDGFQQHLEHRDLDRNQSAAMRQLKETVPIHSIVDQQDYSEAGSFRPRVERQGVHWDGCSNYTLFPVVISFDIRTTPL